MRSVQDPTKPLLHIRPTAYSPAHRNGKVEDAEHPTPLVCHEEVGDQSGRNGGVTGFPDPHQAPGQEEQPEMLGKETRGRWHPTLEPASQDTSPANAGETGSEGGLGLESHRPGWNPGSIY